MIVPGRPQAFGAPGGRALPKLMTVSVIITTRDRATDLQRTCRALQQLNSAPLEVLITSSLRQLGQHYTVLPDES
jgi:hypothetical protein